MNTCDEIVTFAARPVSALDRIEALYLRVLRASLLIVATLLLVWAIGWAALSVLQVMRSPASVVEKPSVVTAADLTSSDARPVGRSEVRSGDAASQREQRAYYDNVVRRYFALYQAKYQPHLRAEDKRLTVGEFDDLTINTASRLDAIRAGTMDFATDRGDLDAFLPVVAAASAAPATANRLARYRSARKQAVSTSVQRTRTESRRGWNPYSTDCTAWYEAPIGCAVTRRVEVPYTQRVMRMRYPDGISSPSEVLKSYQDQYFNLLGERRRANADAADTQRRGIVQGQATGWAGLSRSVLVVAAFLVLMFFFLLVAIERHQRRLTEALPPAA